MLGTSSFRRARMSQYGNGDGDGYGDGGYDGDDEPWFEEIL